jgi:hypothetical protein
MNGPRTEKTKRPGIGCSNTDRTSDDFMDGAFANPPPKKAQVPKGSSSGKGEGASSGIPKCPGHQKPCKLLTKGLDGK